MSDELIGQVLQHYGLANGQLLRVQKGYRNESHALRLADGTPANLILYKNEPGIAARVQRANKVADHLAAADIPARRTLDKRIARLKSGQHTRYASLYAYLPGHTIPWEAYTQQHLKELGRALSDMHYQLGRYPGRLDHHVADEYAAICSRMESYFAEPNVQAAMQKKLGLHVDIKFIRQAKAVLAATKQLPQQQPLHMDFVRGNVLFAEREGEPVISGILDFEKTAQGHPLFDIARTLAFLLVDCKYKPDEKVRKYFLHSGYNKRGKARFLDARLSHAADQESLLEYLVQFFLLHDFYKFLRHNPYESLKENEHYVRTCSLLLRYKRIIML